MKISISKECKICPRGCSLSVGQVGACKARIMTESGTTCENYGHLTSIALDPIEKKPISFWNRGSKVLSVGSYGCNLACPWCQNDSISMVGGDEVRWRFVEPEELISMAVSLQNEGCIGLAFTYNEPLISWEYVVDCAKLAHEAGLINILVTNGQTTPYVLEQLKGLVDAVNIDLKSFKHEQYRKLGGSLDTTLNTIKYFYVNKTHVEVTTLAVPGVSDDVEQIKQIALWIASIDKSMPLHITRFFGCYKYSDIASTPVSKVYSLADEASKYLKNVVVGNC